MCVVRNYHKSSEKIRVKWEFIVSLFIFSYLRFSEATVLFKVFTN